MIDLTAIQDIIYDWVFTVTSRKLFWENQNNSFPVNEKPFFTAKLTNFTSAAHASKGNADVSGNRIIKSDENFVLMLRGFGTGILSHGLVLHKSVQMEQYRDLLATVGVVVVDWLMVVDTSGLDNKEQEERIDMDLQLRIGNEDIEIIEIIEEINATGTVKHGKTGDITVNIDVETP